MPNPINRTPTPVMPVSAGVHGYIGASAIADVAPPSPIQDIADINGTGVPVDGGSGTGVGLSGKGSRYVDATNANIYINAGTKASPLWKLVTRAP